VLTGAISLFHKKFSLAPFLYAGVAGLIASPNLRRMLFSGKEERLLAETSDVLNSGIYKQIDAKYAVQGTGWEHVVEQLMDRKNGDIKPFLTLLRENKGQLPAEDPRVQSFIAAIAPDDPAVRQGLGNMIAEGNFPPFARMLQSASTDESVRGTIQDYVRLGSGKYRKDTSVMENATRA
jgi:hypothetical protein